MTLGGLASGCNRGPVGGVETESSESATATSGTSTATGSGAEASSTTTTTESESESESSTSDAESSGGTDDWACGEGPNLCDARVLDANEVAEAGISAGELADAMANLDIPVRWRIEDQGVAQLRFSVLEPGSLAPIQEHGPDCGPGGFPGAVCNAGFYFSAPGHLSSSDGRLDVEGTLRVDVAGGEAPGEPMRVTLSLNAEYPNNQGTLASPVQVDGESIDALEVGGDAMFTLGDEISDVAGWVILNRSRQIAEPVVP